MSRLTAPSGEECRTCDGLSFRDRQVHATQLNQGLTLTGESWPNLPLLQFSIGGLRTNDNLRVTAVVIGVRLLESLQCRDCSVDLHGRQIHDLTAGSQLGAEDASRNSRRGPAGSAGAVQR